MKLFACDHCQNPLYFHNSVCLNCQNPVGFDPEKLDIISLKAATDGYRPISRGFLSSLVGNNDKFYYCSNHKHQACNWLVPGPDELCASCHTNRTIPDLSIASNVQAWQKLESAKRILMYSLMRLNLPMNKQAGAPKDLKFDFVAQSPNNPATTGHVEGLVTINVEEADEAVRTQNKLNLGERYRTLAGHFRHEVGHYYWDTLIQPSSKWLTRFRKLFGDDREDYASALKRYYEKGAPVNWQKNHISPYATSHPWEDWAETWAHYLHIMSTLETAYAFRLAISPDQHGKAFLSLSTTVKRDPYLVKSFNDIVSQWLPVSFVANSLSRSMGHDEFYPFVLSKPVISKLSFVHDLCRQN